MNVIKRLQRLTGESSREAEKPQRREEIAALRKRIDMIMARRPESRPAAIMQPERRPLPLEKVIPGKDCINAAGVCFVQEHQIEALARHGRRRIGDFAGLSMQAASFLANDPAFTGCRLEEGLFLDTETTGLSGGTGTMAFLIGLGWFDRERFIVHQIFARDFTEERAALNHLAELAGGRRFLVSFNGKSFDVGLLSTRYIMNRLQDPFTRMPHLDLLYPSRRLIAHRLENCRLGTLEEQVLGLIRGEDIPGSEIPQRYFDWLRRRDARLLKDVFDHNRLDIISLAALMDHLTELIDGRRNTGHADARDLLALARLYAERQDASQVRDCLSPLLQSCETEVRREARKMLSLLHKRAGRWEDAVGLWRQMIRDHAGDRFALLELAKWCEHREHDYETALKLVEIALEQTDSSAAEGEKEALVHRRQRLKRRQTQQSPGNH
jgi:hypothetical protein